MICRTKMPRSLQESIESAESNSARFTLIAEAASYMHEWSREDIKQIHVSLVSLEKVGDTVTSFFQQASGGAYPVKRSLCSPKWTLDEALRCLPSNIPSSPEPVINAISELLRSKDIEHATMNGSAAIPVCPFLFSAQESLNSHL